MIGKSAYIQPTMANAVTVLEYAAPELTAYEQVARARLRKLIEMTELGEGANLGEHRSTWLPDSVAAIDFWFTPGVLNPIIRVNIRYQREPDAAPQGKVVSKDKEHDPYLWIGVAMQSHVDGPVPYDGAGFSAIARVTGFEPRQEGHSYDLSNAVEVFNSGEFPSLYCGPLPQTGGFQRFTPFADTSASDSPIFRDWTYDGELRTCDGSGVDAQCSGNYTSQALYLEFNANYCSSRSGMTMTPAYTTPWHAPPAAYHPTEPGGSSLPRDYWGQSIVVDPKNGIKWGALHGKPGTLSEHQRINGNAGINWVVEHGDVEIPCVALGGEYMFHFWAEGVPCETVFGAFHARMVLGSGARSVVTTTDVATGAQENKPDDGGGGQIVVDFFFPEVGSSYPGVRGFYCHDVRLGGDAYGDSVPDHGMANHALYVNLQQGTWRLDAPVYEEPFYGNGTAPQDDWSESHCSGLCDGISRSDAAFAPLSSGRDNGGWAHPCMHGDGFVSDLRGLYQYSMARVLQVTSYATDISPEGAICLIQLIGNDSAAGACDVQQYGYGGIFEASGIDSLTTDANIIGGFNVGDLVTVVGPLNPCTAQGGGGEGVALAVTRPQIGGLNFQSEFYAQLRCGEYEAVQHYHKNILEYDARHQYPNSLEYPLAASTSLRFVHTGAYVVSEG